MTKADLIESLATKLDLQKSLAKKKVLFRRSMSVSMLKNPKAIVP